MKYDFSGRLRQKDDKLNPVQMIELLHQRSTFVYKRQSTHEQVKKSVYSLALQDALEDMAREDGYQSILTKEQVDALRKAPDYPGHYINGQIIVEERDLGISGTLGQDKREGLAHLIFRIERDELESLYVVHISRLFRDQTLIDGFSFGELCKEHNVIIVMPNMRLNLRDKMHMRIYRMELERAAEELDLMKLRLGSTRELKAKHGYYAAGSIALGYVINRGDKDSKDYDRLRPYEPHAAIVRRIFELIEELNYSPIRVARRLRQEGVHIPPFPPELLYMENRSGTMHMISIPGKGLQITKKVVALVVTNPLYIGWWIWGGEVVNKNNHPSLVDAETFWRIQEKFANRKARGRAVYAEPFVLEDLLYCISDKHPDPSRLSASKCDNRYRCKGAIEFTRSDHDCFSTQSRVFEIPIEQFVVSQCSYPQYAERIIQQLRDSYDDAKAQAETNKKEVARLSREIEKLKENLAYTKTEKQAKMILEMIDQRMADLEEKSSVDTYPAGRVGQAIEIDQARLDKVKTLLENLQSIWSRNPPRRLKNELLHIILDRIEIKPEYGQFRVWIRWRIGLTQVLLIHRPPYHTNPENKWTDDETRILREKYPAAEWREIFDSLPRKSITSILSKAHKLGLLPKRRKPGSEKRNRCDWTAEEEKLLIDVINGKIKLSLGELIERLQRHPSGVYDRMKKLGLAATDGGEGKVQEVQWEVVDWGKLDDQNDSDAGGSKGDGNDSNGHNGGGWNQAFGPQAVPASVRHTVDFRIGFQVPHSPSSDCRMPPYKSPANACAPRSRTLTSFTPLTNGSRSTSRPPISARKVPHTISPWQWDC